MNSTSVTGSAENINWLTDADAAFALAHNSGRPLFLYWGASWCPPCNRIKGSVFVAPGFAALAAQCVVLHIDGDSDGAQALAERLAVRSYPTLVVYRPDGSELTRLPCELRAERFIATLALALASHTSAREALDAALTRQRALSDDEWRLLAAYSWDTDEGEILAGRELHAILARLREACSVPDAALRLDWLGLHAAAVAGMAGIDHTGAIMRLAQMLADARFVGSDMDLVTNCAVDLVRFFTPVQSAARATLAERCSEALLVIENDASLHVADQLAAMRTRLRLARLCGLADAFDETAQARLSAALHTTQEQSMRHQVVNTAAGVFSDAGLLDAATRLLSNELARSHSPFFFMHNLAAVAKKRGDMPSALDWYERAWRESVGPATRLQWGASYLLALIEQAPGEVERIESAAAALRTEIGQLRDAHSQRNRTQLERIGAALARWVGGPEAPR